jgi:hypothetical protein
MSEEQALAEWLPPEVEDERQLSRRRFLSGAVVGGAAGLAVAAGTGVSVWKIADAEAQVAHEAARQAAETELQAAKGMAAAEIARLQGLIDLYEGLEKIGLDAILEAGIAALTLPLAAVEAGANVLKGGLEWAEEAVLSLREALPTARESFLWLEAQVSAMADGIDKLETAIGNALDKVTDNTVASALRDFASMVLDNLPFGLGDKIRGVLDGLVDLVTGVDDLVTGINTHFLRPVREKWFPVEEGKDLDGKFLDPLLVNIVDPLEAHLENLSALADAWQQKLMAPAEQALAKRAQVREEIARYKEEHALG